MGEDSTNRTDATEKLDGSDGPEQGVRQRTAARVLILDAAGRVLLFRGGDPARPQDGEWWFTPGGGVEPGESLPAAARREIHEETGHRLGELGPVVLQRQARFSFEGQEYAQTEHYFRVRVERTEVDYSGWTEVERRAVRTHRWWTAEELRTTVETVYPPNLIDFVPLG